MKHPNHFGRWLACVLLCLLLAGCSMPGEQVQVEELLRAPKLSGDYGDVQTALNDWLGESAQLKYPMQGDLLSPFLLQDLDGDGRQDAAVLYTTAQSSNVCIAILQKDDADIWHVRQNVEGLADTVESVGLAQLQPGDATQLVVGYTAAQGDHYLAVYSYTDGVLSTILEQQYQQYLVEDITGGGNQDLILMSTLEDGGVQIELLTVDKEGSFQQVAVMGLSANRFAGCASVAAGVGADGRHYLVLDGWTGISGNNLASVLLRFDEDTQQMVPADQISTEKLYTASLRNVPSLVSQDLDGDGIVEIPTQPDEAGLLNMSQSRRMDFIVWMDYTSPHPEKSFGLLDEETNCYIELPMEWEGNLKLTDSEQYDGAVELRTVDEDQLVMTLRLVRTTSSLKGWTRLGIVASRQMQAKLAPDVEIRDKNYRLSKALYLLNYRTEEQFMVRVLVVEDEANIREMIALNLRLAGMEAVEAESAEAALPLLEKKPGCDAAILDVMLPGMNGFSLCETIRRTDQKIGIIILSAKGQEQDKIRGLSIGADDYMTKPFSVSELLARVKALCRRVGRTAGGDEKEKENPLGMLTSGEFVLDENRRVLLKAGQPIELTQVEFQIMELFFRNPGIALVREKILKGVWGENYFGDVKIVDVNIRRLRMKVEDEPSHPTHILTVWGYGYRWEE